MGNETCWHNSCAKDWALHVHLHVWLHKRSAYWTVLNIKSQQEITSWIIAPSAIDTSYARLTNMSALLIMLLFFIGTHVIAGNNKCIQKYTNRPLNGYYCNNGHYTNVTAIQQHRCTNICIKDPQCLVLSFNAIRHYCLLNSRPCAIAHKHPEILLMIFRWDPDVHCSNWVPPPNDGVNIPPRLVENDPSQKVHCAVGRIRVGANVHPGHVAHIVSSSAGFFIVDGVRVVENSNYELLSVSPNCTLAWFPYTAGEALPPGVLQSGYTENLGPTYSIRVWSSQFQVDLYGVYRIGDTDGYYVANTALTTKEMDILVIV